MKTLQSKNLDAYGILRTVICTLPMMFCLVGIWWLSSMPQPPSPLTDIEFHDKVEHWVAFFCVGVSTGIALRSCYDKREIMLILCAVIFACGYGFVDELHQAFVPNRSVSALDWLADCIGALSSAWFLQWLYSQNIF